MDKVCLETNGLSVLVTLFEGLGHYSDDHVEHMDDQEEGRDEIEKVQVILL